MSDSKNKVKKTLEEKIEKRLEFLAENYNVYDKEQLEAFILEKVNGVDAEGNPTNRELKLVTVGDSTKVESKNLATVIITTSINEEKGIAKVKRKVMINEEVFIRMIAADPTPNKIYLQWMLNVFTGLLKDDRIEDAIRFGAEDLVQANEYLILFDGNKRKRVFTELASKNYSLEGLTDYGNINQYEDLGQLFDAVVPFIERDASALERAMQKFVDSGQAEIPVKDRNYTLFVPLTRDANVVFDSHAGWCTAKKGNGMFDSYTSRQTPLGNRSKIFIIINNDYFTGESDEMYQIHFESRQLRAANNGANQNIYENVISKSKALANYFYSELMPLAKAYGTSGKDNYYVDYLLQFGFSDVLFDMLDINQIAIKFRDRMITKMPDMSRFKNVEMMYLGAVGLVELNSSIAKLDKLSFIAVPENKLKTLPKEIGQCKSLVFMNLVGNKIQEIPDEIAQLDRSNGGMLYRISVRKSDIGEENYSKLQRLLPNVALVDREE
jgi:hypothetical protein